ncbi:MAG: hypothetical protein WA125_10780 [Desulfosporosinus sp.]
MQRKIVPPEPVMVEGKDLADFIFPVSNPEFKALLSRDKYSSREPRNSIQFDDAIVKMFQETFKIDIKTCTEDEWAEKISSKGGAIKQWQSFIKVREAKEIENSWKGSLLLFIALSVLLLIGIGLLPKSKAPVAAHEPTATAVSIPASSTPTVKATLTATAP